MAQTDRNAGLVAGAAVKNPVRASTTANITLSGEQTVDGVALVDGNRCLVKNQTDTTENGIYEVSTGAWTRAKDFNGAYDVKQGTAVWVTDGNTNAKKFFHVTNSDDPTFGTSTITFASGFPASVTATGADTARTLEDHFGDILNVKNFGATGDGSTDDTTAVKAAITAGEASTLGQYTLYFPTGDYKITSQLTFDVTKNVRVIGDGQNVTRILPTSFGADEAVFFCDDTAENNNAFAFSAEKLSIVGTADAKADPIGFELLHPNNTILRDIHVVELGNTAFFLTSTNNTQLYNCFAITCGWQPQTNSSANGVTADITSSSTTLTNASSAIFSASDVGRYIVVADAGYAGGELVTTIASFTSTTEVELTDAAQATVTGKRISFGAVTGSITGGTTLTVDSDDTVFEAGDVGRYIYIPGASTSVAMSEWHVTTIASVTSGVICELTDSADVNVSSVPIIFTPSFAITVINSEDVTAGVQNNDCVLVDCHAELYRGIAYMVKNRTGVWLKQCKSHGINPVTQAGAGRSLWSYVMDDITMGYVSGECSYGNPGVDLGNMRVSGARTVVQWENFIINHVPPENHYLLHVAGGDDDSRVIFGPGHVNARRNYAPVSVDISGGQVRHDAVISGGKIIDNDDSNDIWQDVAMENGAFFSKSQVSIADDAVYSITLPPDVVSGIISIWRPNANGAAMAHFTIDSDAAGPVMESLAAGTDWEFATGDLTGTSATDTKVKISAATDDTLQINNRLGSSVNFSWHIMGGPHS